MTNGEGKNEQNKIGGSINKTIVIHAKIESK